MNYLYLLIKIINTIYNPRRANSCRVNKEQQKISSIIVRCQTTP